MCHLVSWKCILIYGWLWVQEIVCTYEKILNFYVQIMLKMLTVLNASVHSYLHDNYANN